MPRLRQRAGRVYGLELLSQSGRPSVTNSDHCMMVVSPEDHDSQS